jgi:hypothetical protein
MIALLAVALGLSVLANVLNARWLTWVAYLAFFGAIALYIAWRRRVAARRRATVSDREAETRETRTRPDE